MKIIGLMLASNNQENGRSYLDMVTACKETWIKKRHPNVEVISTWGKTFNPYLTEKLNNNEWMLTQENDLLINTEEHRANLLIKTVKGMECALLKYPDLDYVFRPNCGSYICTELLYDFLKDQPDKNYYSGMFGDYKGVEFCSGSCTLYSKDVVEHIVENQSKLQYDGWDMMDDVSMGKFLKESGYKRTDGAKRVMIQTEQQLVEKWDKKCYHHYFCHTINPQLIYKCHELFEGVTNEN